MDVAKFTRRGFFAALLSTLACVFYRIAAHNQWIIVTHHARRFTTSVRPAVRRGDRAISLFFVGDTGESSTQRQQVCASMARQASACRLDAVVLLGDNFYEHGVTSADDPRFQRDFEQAFDPHLLDCPFYPVLGNHDYGSSVQAQVDYTQRSQRWEMPGTYYKVRRTVSGQTLDLYVIDSCQIHEQLPGAQEQLTWLQRELADSDATWKVVAGHHPCLSGGSHDRSEPMQTGVAPLLARYHVDVYFAGHDHDLQLLESGQGWTQVVSGSGSKLRSTSWIAKTIFAAAEPGYVWMLIHDQQLSLSFISPAGHLFTHKLANRGVMVAQHA